METGDFFNNFLDSAENDLDQKLFNLILNNQHPL
jgi:hypothetical protein